MRYVYRNDRRTAPELRSQPCDRVHDARGKCIRGHGNMLVRFADGAVRVVVARQLRIVHPAAKLVTHCPLFPAGQPFSGHPIPVFPRARTRAPRVPRAIVVVLPAFLLTGACGEATPTALRPSCSGRGSVAVSLTAEPTPLVTWSPDCAVARLTVERPQMLGVLVEWDVRSTGAGIVSGVRLGQVPAHARAEVTAQGRLGGAGSFVSLYAADGTFLGGRPF